jgi:hypothetical protein
VEIDLACPSNHVLSLTVNARPMISRPVRLRVAVSPATRLRWDEIDQGTLEIDAAHWRRVPRSVGETLMKTTADELSTSPASRSRSSYLLTTALALALLAALFWELRPNQPIRSGVIASVQWMEGPGSGHFLTRRNVAISVPGGNGGGSSNVDMWGDLYATHLEISYPSNKDRGIQIIPMGQLVGLEFGDAGIKDVGNQTATKQFSK